MLKWQSAAAAAALLLASGCGAKGPTATSAAAPSGTATSASVSATPSATATATRTPTTTPTTLFFKTPVEAGKFLAAAWNAKDGASLHHITNDNSRLQLDDMRAFAKNLKLDTCTKNPDRTFTCEFSHDFLPGKSDPGSVPTPAGHDGPAATSDPHHGKTALKAVAVSKTGWYFNIFLYCG